MPMLGLGAAACFGAGLYASWIGYGGRALAATLLALAFYLAVMLVFAARGVTDFFSSRLGSGGGYLLGSAALLAYLAYAIGTGGFSATRTCFAAAVVFVPLLLAASAEQSAAGAWQDYAVIAGIWALVKFSPTRWQWLWSYPDARFAHVFGLLLMMTVAIATFLLVRRIGGAGYNIGWDQNWTRYVAGSFLMTCAIAIPLGMAVHFIQFSPRWHEWKTIPISFVGILVFTAWPEEFLFRGLLQNMLVRSANNEVAGWLGASVLFGLSHIMNMHFPNWRYAILAAMAGIFYGWTWRKTGSIFAAALVHASVDTSWHFFFR
jgi:membrane protease YdiL (CAAX protease family)